MLDQAKRVLKETFGYDEFRPLQQSIIENILNKNDTLVIMPTGSGKSLCYQIPAHIFTGLTIVVSPLISLMKDQVSQLTELGSDAIVLNSMISSEQYFENVEQIKAGQVKMLYCAPETLLKQDILAMLSTVTVDCLTIDEAHCISEWGHDFRPHYRRLASVRDHFSDAVCIALTATATRRVQDDIIKILRFNDQHHFVGGFDRNNLFLQIVPKSDPLVQTINFINKFTDQSGIVYCLTRKQVDSVTRQLSSQGYSVKPYHAGLPDEERRTNQELFIRDDVKIIVATVAFGMGINKPNIRFILHYDMPKTIENYYQEIGRAGRDGLKAHCLLLFGYGDVQKVKYFIGQKQGQEQQTAIIQLNALLKFLESYQCRRIPLLTYFGETYDQDNCGMCDICISPPELTDDLTIPAQKFLSCVKRTNEQFGANHIIDVLRGSQAKKVLEFKHNGLSTYGIGLEYSKKQWQNLSRQFIRGELLNVDHEYGSLKLTSKGMQVMTGKLPFMGILEEIKDAFTEKVINEKEYDRELFSILKNERKMIADTGNVPPYVIFPDKTLIEMALFFPQTKERLANIHGVGAVKLEKYGETFIDIIRGYCIPRKIEEQISSTPHVKKRSQTMKSGTRHIEIGEAFINGTTVFELMKVYGVQQNTIIDHLYKYFLEGHSLKGGKLMSLDNISSNLYSEIMELFASSGTEFLKPVYTELNGQVSYDDLRLLRIHYLSNRQAPRLIL